VLETVLESAEAVVRQIFLRAIRSRIR
jgi:hypothetical protein